MWKLWKIREGNRQRPFCRPDGTAVLSVTDRRPLLFPRFLGPGTGAEPPVTLCRGVYREGKKSLSPLFAGVLTAAPDTPGQQKRVEKVADAPFQIPRREPGRGAVIPLLTLLFRLQRGDGTLFFLLKVLGSRAFFREGPAGDRGGTTRHVRQGQSPSFSLCAFTPSYGRGEA